ncbi:MAG: SGNH/GDSL hydrolase family protein [Candidatus Nanohaloarchaea archaeon]
MKNVLVFGDSIAMGEKDPEGGWTERFRKELDIDEDYFIYNLGVSGDTTRDTLRRFEDELESRRVVDESSETVLIFQVGINDSLVLLVNDRENQVNIQETQQNMEKIILRALDLADEVLILGLTPVVEGDVDPLPWNSRKAYRYKEIRRYEDAIYELCVRYDVHFIEIYDNFIDRDYAELLEDGLHPNAEGHELLKDIVKDYMEEERMI